MSSDIHRFCWHDCVTKDKAKSLAFYLATFGWTSEEKDMAGGNKYTFLLNEYGKQLGGLVEDKDSSHWLCYIGVANVDDTVKAVTGKGGKQLGSSVDIGEHGRMAVLQDPFGASFAIWQASEKKKEPEAEAETKKKGKGKADVPYSALWPWHEVMTAKGADASSWYAGVFGWDVKEEKMGDGPLYYQMGIKGEMPFCGTMDKPEKTPVGWMSYIGVPDVDDALDLAKENGATITKEGTDVPNYGRFGLFVDPAGANVCLYTPPAPSKKRKAPKAKAAPKKKKAKKNSDDDDYHPSGDDDD